MATEIPQSVLLDYDPANFGPGTTTNSFKYHKIIEPNSHRRKLGNSLLRTIHIIDQKGEAAPKTIRVEAQGEYSTIYIIDHGTNFVGEIQVNGTHLRINNGQSESKYSFSGRRIAEDEHAIQLPLEGFIQLSLDDAVLFERRASSLECNTLPSEINSSLVELLVGVARTIRSPKEPLAYQKTLQLGDVFQELNTSYHPFSE